LYHRVIRIKRTPNSLHFRSLRRYPVSPKTLGEHLRKKRIDMHLSMTQLANLTFDTRRLVSSRRVDFLGFPRADG
jgi:hypothetical protein